MSIKSAYINPSSKIPEMDEAEPDPYFPEKRLAAAVLLRAILDTRALEKKQRWHKNELRLYNTSYKKDAWEFLKEEYEHPYPPYSALWCFEHFCDNPTQAQKLTIEACKLAVKKKLKNDKKDSKQLLNLIELIRKEKSSK